MKVLWISAIVVILDQVTKLAIKGSFRLHESIKILGEFLQFTYIENPGMAFGIQIGGKYFFTIFASIATLIIVYYLYRTRYDGFATRLALSLILGGAIGNLIDRYAYGQVIDFIDVGYASARWPVFNIADSGVTVGMIILITILFFERQPVEAKDEQPAFQSGQPSPSDEHDNWKGTKEAAGS